MKPNKYIQSKSQIEEAIGKEPSSMTRYAGKTLAENLQDVPDLKEGQMLIYPIDRPIKASGHIQIMYGNLAPEGCVGKITGKEGLEFEGPARVFDSEELMLKAVEAGPQQLKVSCVSIPKICRPVNFESCMWALQNFASTMAEFIAMSAWHVFNFQYVYKFWHHFKSHCKSFSSIEARPWSMSKASCETLKPQY